MTKLTQTIINVDLGEQLTVELTPTEIAEMVAEAKLLEKQEEATKAAKAALLDRLGINAEEAALLLG
jgi:hypothetical protein